MYLYNPIMWSDLISITCVPDNYQWWIQPDTQIDLWLIMTGWQTCSLIKRNFQSSHTLFPVAVTKGMRRWKRCLSHFRLLCICWLPIRKWPFPGRRALGGPICGRWEVRLAFNQGGRHLGPGLAGSDQLHTGSKKSDLLHILDPKIWPVAQWNPVWIQKSAQLCVTLHWLTLHQWAERIWL